MYRIEIIANRSVEENLLEALKDEGTAKFYTKFPNVFGVGTSGPRMGDAIWPEENFAFVIWCDAEEAYAIARAVAHVKEHFPGEGIKLFGMPEQLSQGQTIVQYVQAPAAAAQPAAPGPATQPTAFPAGISPAAVAAPADPSPALPAEEKPPAEPVHIGDVGDYI